ncbi:MAG: NADH-quinone oxidoreductase subunit NuoE [Lentimicrobium sp.]|jgi:NADH-quinone oxidoreductase subunit E|nr:NADH-quinone oxidoreductase subunit NuoE [Lentimicrobium sp.]
MADILDEIIERHVNTERDGLIPLLQEVQSSQGFLSEDAIIRIGASMELPTSKIYGVATFYDQFRFEPRGRVHFQVCHGTTCHINHSLRILQEIERLLKIKPGQTTRDGMFSVDATNCMGACSLSPVIKVNDTYYHDVSPADLKEIIEKYKSNPLHP